MNPINPSLRMHLLMFALCLGSLVSRVANAQGFNQFVARVYNAPDSNRTAIVDSFMNAAGALPLIERDSTVYFVYRGSANSVNAAGDMNAWDISAYPMYRLSTTNLWFMNQTFEHDARLDYKFVTDGVNWLLDPRNPNQVMGGYGPNSELRMPGYVPAPEIQYYPSIPHGTVTDTVLYSSDLANSRHIRVYTPAGYSASADSLGVILFHDGLDYLTLGSAANVLDYLIAQNLIQPIIGVFVPPVNRGDEYIGSQITQFTLFIVDQVMPYIDARYRTRLDPYHRAVLGASNGGYISLWLGLNHPEVFGCIAPESSTTMAIASSFQNASKLPLRFSIDVGTYDIPGFLQGSRDLVGVLQSMGYDYRYAEYHEGHSWGNWRAHFGNALKMFFPKSPVAVRNLEPKPLTFVLEQNFPNPFNPTTEIRYHIGGERGQGLGAGDVRLVVYDILGREAAVIVNEPEGPGLHTVTFDASVLPSGVYFYSLTSTGYTLTRKMIFIK